MMEVIRLGEQGLGAACENSSFSSRGGENFPFRSYGFVTAKERSGSRRISWRIGTGMSWGIEEELDEG